MEEKQNKILEIQAQQEKAAEKPVAELIVNAQPPAKKQPNPTSIYIFLIIFRCATPATWQKACWKAWTT